MSRARTPRSRTRLALTGAAVLAGVSVPAVASATGDDGVGIVVENAGDQANAIRLPASAVVGQTAQTTLVLVMDLSVDAGGMSTEVGIGLEMAMTSEVTELTDDGGYVAVTTLDNVEITDLPEGADESGVPCIGVAGVQLEQTFDAAGNAVSAEAVGGDLGPAEAACVEQLTSTQSQATIVFPSEPIGPGASWSADLVTENQGIEIPVTYHYALTDVSDGRYTIEASLDSDFEVEQDGISGTGNMSGSGSTTGAVDNPLDVSTSFDVALDMVSSLEDGDMSMTVDMDIDVLSEVPPS
jgi:Family of unknown function (DUF6263)